jgi:hypothetical protein
MFLKQEEEDAEIQFGTSHLRLVGLLGGLENLSFISFLPVIGCRLMLRRPGMEVEPPQSGPEHRVLNLKQPANL